MRKVVFTFTVLFALCGCCGWTADGWPQAGPAAAAGTRNALTNEVEAVELLGYTAVSKFLYTRDAGGGVTLTGFTGNDAVVRVPPYLGGGLVGVIGEKAFYGKDALVSVTLPFGVSNLLGQAFDGCDALTGVYLSGPAPVCASDALSTTPCTVYYLAGFVYGATLDLRPTAVWGPALGVASWVPYPIASALTVTLAVANGNLQVLQVTNPVCVIAPPAVDAGFTQTIRLEVAAGTNTVVLASSVSNAEHLAAFPTNTVAPLLFDQPYGRPWWKVVGL